MKSPVISVIMSVYNGDEYLSASIDSILNQTYRDFEFIIINDGSNDQSEKIILSYLDNRIKYIENKENKGLVYCLNYGLSIATGFFIARMDADDISKPERFQKQLEFLNLNPFIDLVGTSYEKINETENLGYRKQQNNPRRLKFRLLFGANIAHPTVMFRRKLVDDKEYIYNNEFSQGQDYELWTRLAINYQLDNLSESLFLYRVHANQVSITKSIKQKEYFRRAHKIYVQSLFKISNEDFLNEVVTFFLKPSQLPYLKRIIVASKIFRLSMNTDIDKKYCFIRLLYWAIIKIK